MKLALSLALAVLQTASAMKISPIAADSKAGVELLSKSRLLDGEDGGDGGDDDDGYTWMQDYSIKFLGCHHVAHWNSNADEAEDVKMMIERHVRYRLCPSSSCSSSTGLGCSSGYGDYIVDMDTFLQSYLKNKEEIEEEQCENRLNQCGCGQGDDNGDDDQDKCEYNCFNNKNYSHCIENNPYYDDGQNEKEEDFDLDGYTYCAQVGGGNEDRKRQLNEDEAEYFLGPFCGDRGDSIYLGMFTENTCTEYADSSAGADTYYETYGSEIPYHGVSLVDKSCYTCKDYNYDEGEVETREICPDIYDGSGKCEAKISTDVIAYPNENACNYIDGIKVLKHSANGVVYRPYHGTKGAALAIAFFATLFIVLAFYVCNLRSRVRLAKKRAALAAGAYSTSPKSKKGFFKTLKKKLSFRRNKKKDKEASLMGN